MSFFFFMGVWFNQHGYGLNMFNLLDRITLYGLTYLCNQQ